MMQDLEYNLNRMRIPGNKALLFVLIGEIAAYRSVCKYILPVSNVVTTKMQHAYDHIRDLKKMVEMEKKLLAAEGVRITNEELIKLENVIILD